MMEKKILNVGCGEQKYGTHRIDLYPTTTTTHTGDLNKPFPFPDNYFDEVYSSCLLEHLTNLENFVSECYRVLKNHGDLYVHTDNAGYLPFHLFKTHEHNAFLDKQYIGGVGYGHKKHDDGHYHLFVASHLKNLFKDFCYKKINYTYGGRNAFSKFLLRMLPKHLGSIGISITAKKVL